MGNSINVSVKNDSGKQLFLCVQRANGHWLSINATISNWTPNFNQTTCVAKIPKAKTLKWEFLKYITGEGARMFVGDTIFNGTPDLVTFPGIYDKVEMGWNAIWNLSNVDFFSFPMRIEGNGKVVGYISGSTRKNMMAKLAANPAPYKNLKFPNTGTVIRYFGPGMFVNPAHSSKLQNCFGKAIKLGLPQLATYKGCFDYGGFEMSNFKMNGTSGNSITLDIQDTNSNPPGSIKNYTMSTITTVTAAGNTIQNFTSPKDTASEKAAAVIGAAITRGVLYDPNKWGKSVPGNPGTPTNYYKNDPKNGNQWNHYAKVLHDNSEGGLCYAMSYDDVFHQDASIQFNGGDTANITIMPFN